MGDAALGLLCSTVAYLLTACILLLAGVHPSAGLQFWTGLLALAAAATCWRYPGCWALALPTGAVCLAWAQAHPARPSSASTEPSPCAVQGEVTVLSSRFSAWGVRRLRIRTETGAEWHAQSQWTAPLNPGDRVLLWGEARAFASGWSIRHAVWRRLSHEASQPSSAVFVPSWRERVRAWIASSFPQPSASWARALLLGESFAAPQDHRRSYRELGLLHLLSISGMHFWVWSALLRRMLPACLRGLRWPLLGTLAVLADFSPAVIRAGVALALRDLSASRGLALSPWTLWSAALSIEVLRSSRPSLGFLLSYSATAGLLLARIPRGSPTLYRVLIPSTAAALCTAPLLHARQATLEFWSIPCTPLFAALLPLRMLCVAGSCVPPLRTATNHVLHGLDWGEELLLEQLARLPGTPWVLPQVSSVAVGAACLVALAALLARAKRGLARLSAGTAILALVIALDARKPTGWHWTRDWVIGAEAQGTVLFPRHARVRLDGFGLDRDLMPALARLRARGPWWVAFLHSEEHAQLQQRLPAQALHADSIAEAADFPGLHPLPNSSGWWADRPQGSWVMLDPHQAVQAVDLLRSLPSLRPQRVFAPRPLSHDLDLSWLAHQWQVESWHAPKSRVLAISRHQ